MLKFFLVAVGVVCVAVSVSSSQMKFYNYYNAGLEYMEKGDWLRAIEELNSAASIEFEDATRRRTYGTRFIEYYPHRELGVAFYQLGEFERAYKELELSLAYTESSRGEEYMNLVRKRVPPTMAENTKRKKDMERQQELERQQREKDERAARDAREKQKQEDERLRLEKETRDREEAAKKENFEGSKNPPLPVGAKTYDPSRVTRVGSRLALAVLPFEGQGQSAPFAAAASDKLVEQLVALRRFKVIERGALDKIMKEQRLQTSGIVDEQTAVKVGKVAGADAIVMGTISIIGNTTKVNARVIDTETSETIVARSENVGGKELADIERVVELVAINIYNELPIVEGYIIDAQQDNFYIDVGTEKGLRKGSKCVAFREGAELKHPKTGEVLAKKVTPLGELVVINAQEKVSEVRIVSKEQEIVVGDKIVVK